MRAAAAPASRAATRHRRRAVRRRRGRPAPGERHPAAAASTRRRPARARAATAARAARSACAPAGRAAVRPGRARGGIGGGVGRRGAPGNGGGGGARRATARDLARLRPERRLAASSCPSLLVPDVHVRVLRQRHQLVDELACARTARCGCRPAPCTSARRRRRGDAASGRSAARGAGGAPARRGPANASGSAPNGVRGELRPLGVDSASAGMRAPRGARHRGRPADAGGQRGRAGRRAPSSRTVMTFAQVLHLTLRIFPRTLSSAMEYLVWQRSQTNFIPFGTWARQAPLANERENLSSQRDDYHRRDADRDEAPRR